jgi:MATE family multidrug resistance protein
MPESLARISCKTAEKALSMERTEIIMGAMMTWTERWRGEGGNRELMRLALPLILSSSFLTLQVFVDRAMLSHYSSNAVAAAMPAALLYWTPFLLLQNVANYATTFVAQYTGAGRHERVGPAIWQAFYFSLVAGILFLGFYPLAPYLVALGDHSPAVQELEIIYFRCLCFAGFPALIVATANSFFAGRGDSWTVLLIDAVGLTVNAALAYCWIFGALGMPEWGIAGAGWATVAGSSVSALLAVTLILRPKWRARFHTLSGWKFDPDLFRRLMRFGFPNGLQWMLDVLAFTVFLFLIGRLGDVELAATNIAFTINMVAVLPMLGMGQGVSILVGQRLGQDRPHIAERSTWNGFGLAWLYMGTVAAFYALTPGLFLFVFQGKGAQADGVAALVPVLLRFVAIYSLFDSMNLVFSFALRGAGDTRFVTVISLALSWPIMVVPSWAAWYYGWGLYWAWTFASVYVIALGFTFMLRFRAGKWKTMRVIERAPGELHSEPTLAPVPVEV